MIRRVLAFSANLAKLKTGNLVEPSIVIKALQHNLDNAALIGRLASELTMVDTFETAFIMRRMVTTELSEPNASAQKVAMEEG